MTQMFVKTAKSFRNRAEFFEKGWGERKNKICEIP
jgi:hypothetical protein